MLGFARSVVFLINVMNDATSIPVAAPPPGISSYLAAFLSSWSARSTVPFRIVFADGSEFRAGDAEPAFTLRFRTRRAERRLALFGHVALLEAYFEGELDVDGDFALAFRAAIDAKLDDAREPARRASAIAGTNSGSPTASIAQAKANAAFHYDLAPYVLPACGSTASA